MSVKVHTNEFNMKVYLNDVEKLQRILKVELFFRRLADLASKPFNFVAHLLHIYWCHVYDNRKEKRNNDR